MNEIYFNYFSLFQNNFLTSSFFLILKDLKTIIIFLICLFNFLFQKNNISFYCIIKKIIDCSVLLFIKKLLLYNF